MRYLCNSRQLVCVAVWTCVCCGIDRAFISRRLTPHVAIELILACTYTTFPAPRAVLGQLAPERLATTHRVTRDNTRFTVCQQNPPVLLHLFKYVCSDDHQHVFTLQKFCSYIKRDHQGSWFDDCDGMLLYLWVYFNVVLSKGQLLQVFVAEQQHNV